MSAMAARARRVAGYDGRLSQGLLTIWRAFCASVGFLLANLPLALYQALVGWQPTHLAIALAALAVLPLVPAVHALLAASAELLDRGADASTWRTFWGTLRRTPRPILLAAAATAAVTALLSYDIALLGDLDGVVASTAAAAALGLVIVLALSLGVLEGRPGLVEALEPVIRRPWVALTWVVLVAVALLGSTLPVVGSTWALFAPVLVGLSVVVTSRALLEPRSAATRH